MPFWFWVRETQNTGSVSWRLWLACRFWSEAHFPLLEHLFLKLKCREITEKSKVKRFEQVPKAPAQVNLLSSYDQMILHKSSERTKRTLHRAKISRTEWHVAQAYGGIQRPTPRAVSGSVSSGCVCVTWWADELHWPPVTDVSMGHEMSWNTEKQCKKSAESGEFNHSSSHHVICFVCFPDLSTLFDLIFIYFPFCSLFFLCVVEACVAQKMAFRPCGDVKRSPSPRIIHQWCFVFNTEVAERLAWFTTKDLASCQFPLPRVVLCFAARPTVWESHKFLETSSTD